MMPFPATFASFRAVRSRHFERVRPGHTGCNPARMAQCKARNLLQASPHGESSGPFAGLGMTVLTPGAENHMPLQLSIQLTFANVALRRGVRGKRGAF